MFKTLFDNDAVLPKSESQEIYGDFLYESVDDHIDDWPIVTFSSDNCVILARDESNERLVISKNRITV